MGPGGPVSDKSKGTAQGAEGSVRLQEAGCPWSWEEGCSAGGTGSSQSRGGAEACAEGSCLGHGRRSSKGREGWEGAGPGLRKLAGGTVWQLGEALQALVQCGVGTSAGQWRQDSQCSSAVLVRYPLRTRPPALDPWSGSSGPLPPSRATTSVEVQSPFQTR